MAKKAWSSIIRGLQRDVVYLGWPIALLYLSPNAGGRGYLRGLSQWVQLYTGAQINFGDLTPYLTYVYNTLILSGSVSGSLEWRRMVMWSCTTAPSKRKLKEDSICKSQSHFRIFQKVFTHNYWHHIKMFCSNFHSAHYMACLAYLKVVGNEKVGGSGRWQMIRIYLGPWWSMSVLSINLAAILY